MGSLAFSPLCVPYVALGLETAFLAALALVIRGDAVLRLAILCCCAVVLPWAISFVVVGCTDDPVLAEHVYRVGYGPAPLCGPALMMLVLGVSGRFDGHRVLVGVAFLSAFASTVICWSTDWIVAGVHVTPSGLLYSTPGWLQIDEARKAAEAALAGVRGRPNAG